jgi:hypothetical protein
MTNQVDNVNTVLTAGEEQEKKERMKMRIEEFYGGCWVYKTSEFPEVLLSEVS